MKEVYKGYETRIHLAKVHDGLEPACSIKPSFNTIYVANDHSKVTCFHCKRHIEALKNAVKRSLAH